MSASQPRPVHILYYRHDRIVVTSTYFWSDTAEYKLDELSDLAQTEGPRRSGLTLALTIAALDLLAVVPLLMFHLALVALVLSAPILIAACVYGADNVRRPGRLRELVARYRGRQVTLYSTTDEHRFGQVARALLRAMERADRGEHRVR